MSEADNFQDAKNKLSNSNFDLVVLDVRLVDDQPFNLEGLGVLHYLKLHSPSTKSIVITGYPETIKNGQEVKEFILKEHEADAFILKVPKNSSFAKQFMNEVRKLFGKAPEVTTPTVKHSNSSLFHTNLLESVFSISCKPGHCPNIRVSGEIKFNDTSKELLHIETDLYARYADQTYFDYRHKNKWRFQSKDTGKKLFQKIFVDHPNVLKMYNQVLGAINKDEELHFRFEAEQEFLRVPLELFYSDREYLVLQYPMARSNSSVRIKTRILAPSFFNELWSKNEALRILLIASNTTSNTIPSIPGVDEEIDRLKASVKTMFEDIGILVQMKAIPTYQATYETVKKELRDCHYHIIHYAGHGNHDTQSPDKSSLYFWEKPYSEGEVKQMTISELKMLLRNSEVHFLYLSCCFGTATGESAKLLDDDFLGIADGLVQAGVPSVLGFRWPVSDSGALTLSREFYQSLARQGQIDTALLHARCEVAAKDRDDITWVSPILIMQD